MNKTQVDFCKDFKDREALPSQVFIAIGGKDNASIVEHLTSIINDIRIYGKPMQGTGLHYHAVKQVITPVWNGKEY